MLCTLVREVIKVRCALTQMNEIMLAKKEKVQNVFESYVPYLEFQIGDKKYKKVY